IHATAARFCNLFVTGAAPTDILDQCFSANPKITEHGPQWATTRLPYLNHTFAGRRRPKTTYLSPEPTTPTAADNDTSCDAYFDVLGATLAFLPHCHDAMPPADDFIVSAGAGKKEAVVVRAMAKIASVETGLKWEETFVFMFGEFDKDAKIGHLEIFSDGLSAW
ncbi:hypothetical protein DM02DRAFT_474014, partial [Periconia macrospinosa]